MFHVCCVGTDLKKNVRFHRKGHTPLSKTDKNILASEHRSMIVEEQ